MKRFFNFLRRKLVWIPLSLVAVVAALLAITHYRYMSSEAFTWEIGMGIRGRLDEFSHHFKEGDPGVIATYYHKSFAGTEFGFEKRERISTEGGILLEEWRAPAGVTLDRDQMLEQVMAYRAQLHDPKMTKFKMVFLNEFSATHALALVRFQVYAKDAEGRKTEDRGHFHMSFIREDGVWLIDGQKLLGAEDPDQTEFPNPFRVTALDSPYFVDVTAEAGIDFNTGRSDIFEYIDHNFAIVDRASGGVTSGDYDRDGYPDLFLAGPDGSKLYRNTGDGRFEDVTAAAGLDNGTTKYAQGCVFADYNNDGYLDLFITKTPKIAKHYFLEDWPFEQPEKMLRIFEASPENAEKISRMLERPQAEVARLLKETPEAVPALADELYERWFYRLSNRLLKNNGDGSFTDVTEAAGLMFNSYSTTAGFADIDNDGDLDLYVGVYGPAREYSPDPPFHDRYGLPDKLYRNSGYPEFTFIDITDEAKVGDPGWALGMTFWDFDNDGDQDIYVANDFGFNSLFENDGTGHFQEVSKEHGLLDYGFGMSASPGDYDNDGDLDMYVSNIYSGTTWYIQHNIMQFLWVRFIDPSRTWRSIEVGSETYRNLDGLDGVKAVGRKFGEGNSLLENHLNPREQGERMASFTSIGERKGVNMAGWAWGSSFFDFDNDGDLDVHSTNGWITGKIHDDL